MSITNSTLIRDALGLIGVLAEIEPASAEQIEHGMRVMNELLEAWRSDGIDLQYSDQTEAGAETPIPSGAVAAVKHFLGFALAPYYRRSVSSELIAVGNSHYARLTRDAVKDELREATLRNIPLGESPSGVYDIINDRV